MILEKNTFSVGRLVKYALLSASLMLWGCGDDEPSPDTSATKSETSKTASPALGAVTGAPALKVKTDEELAKQLSAQESKLKFLVDDNDLFVDIFVKDTYGREYDYQVCVGDKCTSLVRDLQTDYFKYSCDKLNSKTPCSPVMKVQACRFSDKTCESRLIDFAGPLRAKKVVIGYEHACAIRLNDTVACWGKVRGYANTDGTNSIVGTIAKDIFISKSQDVTCSIDFDHNFRCFGADAKRFKPVESLVKYASISINSICYVTIDSKPICIPAEGEDSAYIAYTNPDGSDFRDLSDIKKIETEEFFTVALDYKGRLHLLGFNLDNTIFRKSRESLESISSVTKVQDFSIGNDAVCAIVGDSKQSTCFGPRKNFDYSQAAFNGIVDVKSISVGSQSGCIIYYGNDGRDRVLCGGIPFYYEGLDNQTDAIGVSQGNNQVCVIRPDHQVDCYGNDYHRNGVNFVPVDQKVVYEVNGIIGASLPKEWNPKLDNTSCRINAKYHEVICRIARLDFLPKDLRIKPKFDLNSIEGKLEVEGMSFVNGASSITLQPEQSIVVKVPSGENVQYKLKLLQVMKVSKTYDLNKIWDGSDGSSPDQFSCVWSFSDGTTDEGPCEEPMKHVFETDFSQSRRDLSAKVDAYLKEISVGGFDVRHYFPKSTD